MTTTHPRRTRERGRGPRAVPLALLLLLGTGCTHVTDPIPHASADSIKAALNAIPKPPGATLIDEHVEEGNGDTATSVIQTYRTTGTEPACVQLINAVQGTDWRILRDLTAPLDAATCDPSVPNPDFPEAGNDEAREGLIRRTDTRTGAIRVIWRHDQLIFRVSEGDLLEP